MQDGHAVADGLDLAQFVGGEEDRLALLLQPLDDLAHLHAADGIQTTGGFVQQEQVRIVDQRLGQAHPLLHALGIGADRTATHPFQFHQFEQAVDALGWP